MMKKQRNLSESTWKTLSSRQIYQNKWLSLLRQMTNWRVWLGVFFMVNPETGV